MGSIKWNTNALMEYIVNKYVGELMGFEEYQLLSRAI